MRPARAWVRTADNVDLAAALLLYVDKYGMHPVASQGAAWLLGWLREMRIKLGDTKALLALIYSRPIPRRMLRPMRRILKRINRRAYTSTGFPLPPRAWWDEDGMIPIEEMRRIPIYLIESSHVRQIPTNPLGPPHRDR